MLDKGLFLEVYGFMQVQHQWSEASEAALSELYNWAAKGISSQDFEKICDRVMARDAVTLPDFLQFLSCVLATKAGIEPPKKESEERAKFIRALRLLPSYKNGQEHVGRWYQDLWMQPLTVDDHIYSASKRFQHILQFINEGFGYAA